MAQQVVNVPTTVQPIDANTGNFVINWLNFFQNSAAIVNSVHTAATKSQNVTATSTTTIDLSLGYIINLSLAATITSMVFTNKPVAGDVCVLTFIINNTGAFTISSWTTGTKWPSATLPTITSGSGTHDLVSNITVDGGTTWYGWQLGANFS